MEWVMTHGSDIIEVALAILGLASIIAKLTPTKADNAVVDAILRIVHAVGLTK